MTDRERLAYMAKAQPVTGLSDGQVQELADHVADTANALCNAFLNRGFDRGEAVFLCGQILTKLV